MARVASRVILAVGTLLCLSALASAQTTTSTTQTKKFEVISVTGNQVVVKLPEGTKEITVPEDFKFDVDGKQVTVHDLKPGMKGTANITTKTTVTPVTVTEVKNGTVMQASGSSLIVKTAEGTIKMFSPGDVEKRNVKLTRDGQPLDFSDLHTGDKLTATIVTAHPPKVVTEQQVKASLAKEGGAAPAGAPAAKSAATSGTAPAAGAGAAPTAGAASPGAGAAPAAKKLPKTASQQPLVMAIGLVSLFMAIALTTRRRWLER
jgi:LPXTG-motif cell wall-anchored protein